MFFRFLALLLACLNVAVALWWWHQPKPLPRILSADAPDVPALTLLAEAEAERQPQTAEMVEAPAALEALPICLSIGPFDTPSALRAAAERLDGVVGKLQYRESRVAATRGFRVFLPAASNRAAALAQARALAAKGIRDYYVVTAGPEENTISLGLFREEENARTRHAELAALGIEAQLLPANEERPQWQLEVAVAADADWRTALGTGDWQVRPMPCF